MVIHTGNHKPVCVPQPHYGLYESPIMQKTIDELIRLKFIIPDFKSAWGSRITLAPKPHQEQIKTIKDFVWRFCINYILLNRVTRPSEYPIPRCDDAVMYGFGEAAFFILIDAHSGYHQIKLSPITRSKTAFFAPHGRKYVYVVMPFGLRNAPAVFVAIMHDLKALWTAMSSEEGVAPSDDNGTKIIIDDIMLFAVKEDNAFIILKCVCIIARKYHLTLKLKKCQWFPSKVEFVGVDVSTQGNQPAESKYKMLNAWPIPKTPRNIMSFLGFGIFYSRWIPYFEIIASPLRHIIKTYPIDHELSKPELSANAIKAYNILKGKILSAPILQRANTKKRMYLKTDFSAKSLGYALCQPNQDKESLEAMREEMNGGPCKFDMTLKGLRLLPISFGSRRTIGNEQHFHSHPGETLAANWGINKNRHFLWGAEFTLITDCHAMLWIMTYNGSNHAIKRLQLELSGYFFTIVHRPGRMMEDANYLSRLNANSTINPLLKDYINQSSSLLKESTPPEGEITKDNTPGRKKKKQRTSSAEITDDKVQINYANIIWDNDTIPEFNYEQSTSTFLINQGIQNTPISHKISASKYKKSTAYNHECLQTAIALKHHSWCLINPKFGHWIDLTHTKSIPYQCVVAIERSQECRDTLQHHHHIQIIHPTIASFVSDIQQNKTSITIQGLHICLDEEDTKSPSLQSNLKQLLDLINILQSRSGLSTIAIEIHQDMPLSILTQFKANLISIKWTIITEELEYEQFSDHITGKVTVIIGIHRNFIIPSQKDDLTISRPPRQDISFQQNISPQFNTDDFAIPQLEDLFEIEYINETNPRSASIQAIIKPKNDDYQNQLGYQLFDQTKPAPLPSYNLGGLFGQLFGMIYNTNDTNKRQCRAISSLEYISMFLYSKELNYHICTKMKSFTPLISTTPFNTMLSIINTTYNILNTIQNTEIKNNSNILGESLSVSTSLNGLTIHKLPGEEEWTEAYRKDKTCKTLISMIKDPSLITQCNLQQVHFIYRMPIRQSHITYANNRLVLHEPTVDQHKIINLTIVPNDIQRHIFTAFHANPLGGHFSLYHTLHRIRIRFHWPGMYKYIKRMIHSCAACILKNSDTKLSSELLYSFPLDAPMNTIHCDVWQPGKTEGYDGDTALMKVLCHMTTFAAIEPLKKLDSTTFSKTVYRIMMRYGLSALIVTDHDAKFKGQFKDMCKMLNIPHHLSARGNHNAVIVERFNRYLNSGMRIFTSDRATPRVFLEGAETLCYAWNSAPVSGTDLSRSLLVTGRKFKFPIDIQNSKSTTFEVNEETIKTYTQEMTELLIKCREIYLLLINEHRALHREHRNSQLNNPKKFNIGDIVFTNVQIQSQSSLNKVKKLSYSRRGPYKIITRHPSGSYDLTLLGGTNKSIIKKHGSDLIQCPKELIPHQSITNSSDQLFSNLNKSAIPNPYKYANIDGFNTVKPWETAPAALANLKSPIQSNTIPSFPTIKELDTEFDSWPESGNPFLTQYSIDNTPSDINNNTSPVIVNNNSIDYTVNPTQLLNPSQISQSMQLSHLIQSIVLSTDKLFFIAYQQTNNQRREWKLIQIDFPQSMSKYPQCLQTGKFIANFLIQYPKDSESSFENKRYWTEYHESLSNKQLNSHYHLIQPSEVTQRIATQQNLVPYREWINLSDTSIRLHGPFDFAILNHRKTRDRINTTDWAILRSLSKSYDNDPPNLTKLNET